MQEGIQRKSSECRPTGSSAHGIFQARVLEWGVIASSAECDKIIANETTDKGLISKTAHINQSQKNKQPNQKVDKGPKQTSLQRHTYD